MRLFRWLSATPIPLSLDLRRLGWDLAGAGALQDDVVRSPVLAQADMLDEPRWSELGEWRFAPLRSLILLIGIDDPDARARMLRLGYGDATGGATSLREIEARALRLATQAMQMPRTRQFGQLRLDLFAREAFAGERRLGLHPREFALLWRLTDTPGQPVLKRALIRDVWRMAHVPETNSLAVHVYRLRAKLTPAGLEWMVRTTIDGGYLFAPVASSRPPPAPFMLVEGGQDDDAQLTLSVYQGLTRETQS